MIENLCRSVDSLQTTVSQQENVKIFTDCKFIDINLRTLISLSKNREDNPFLFRVLNNRTSGFFVPLIRKDLKSNIPFSIFLTRFDNDTYQYLETLRGSDTILRSDMTSRNLMCLIFTLFCPDYAKEIIFWQFLTLR